MFAGNPAIVLIIFARRCGYRDLVCPNLVKGHRADVAIVGEPRQGCAELGTELLALRLLSRSRPRI